MTTQNRRSSAVAKRQAMAANSSGLEHNQTGKLNAKKRPALSNISNNTTVSARNSVSHSSKLVSIYLFLYKWLYYSRKVIRVLGLSLSLRFFCYCSMILLGLSLFGGGYGFFLIAGSEEENVGWFCDFFFFLGGFFLGVS